MITHPYEYMHAHPILMNTFEKLGRLDLEIHEVGHEERRREHRLPLKE
jgi:hypothetical protein